METTKEVQDYLNALSKALSDQFGVKVTATIKPGKNKVTLTLESVPESTDSLFSFTHTASIKGMKDLLETSQCDIECLMPTKKPSRGTFREGL